MAKKVVPFKQINKKAKKGIKKRTGDVGSGPGVFNKKRGSRKIAKKGRKL